MTSPSSSTVSRIRAKRVWNWVVVSTATALVAAVVLGYPALLELGAARFGVRGTALALFLMLLPSLAGSLAGDRRARIAALPVMSIALLIAFALLSESRASLRIIPAVVHACLASVCFASLRGEESLLEQGARFLVPELPDFVRPYCRKVTALWGLYFALSTLIVVALAPSEAQWRAYTGGWFFAGMALFAAVEFFVRKTWFRYYFHGGLFDRVWSRLFPAENTEAGRRSLEYIRRFREEASA